MPQPVGVGQTLQAEQIKACRHCLAPGTFILVPKSWGDLDSAIAAEWESSTAKVKLLSLSFAFQGIS